MPSSPTPRLRTLSLVILVGLATLILVSAASNLGLKTTSENPGQLSGPQKARAAEAFSLRGTLGEDIWPGWGKEPIPQILYNESYAFLLHLEDPEPGWYSEPGHLRRGGPWEPVPDDSLLGSVYYRQRLDSPEAGPQAFAVRVGDGWAGSMATQEWARIDLGRRLRGQLPPLLEWIPPYRLLARLFFRDAEHQISLILHESFHAFQGREAEARFSAAERIMAVAEEYPWELEELEEGWAQELDLLAEALVRDSPSESRALARDFLAVRQSRRSGMPPKLAAFEEEREWLEGLAKYVEIKSLLVARKASLPPGSEGMEKISWAAEDLTAGFYVPHAALVDDPGFNAYRGAAEVFLREAAQIRRMAGQGEGRFYYSGMALAFLLDRFGPSDWKLRAMQDPVSLDALLAHALGEVEE